MATADLLALRADHFGAGRTLTRRGTGSVTGNTSLLDIVQRLARGEMPEFTNATRPAATAVPRSSMIRNTDTGTIQMSNGTTWENVLANEGVIPSARLLVSVQPADTDTVTIDGHIFQFDGATPPVAAGGAASTAIFRGANLAAAQANLLDAINGVVNAATVTPGTGALGAVASLVADQLAGNIIRIRRAATRGGAAQAGALAGALAEGLTQALDVWNAANLNVSGRARGALRIIADMVTITAAMITFGSMNIELPFTPTILHVGVRTALGVEIARAEAITIDGNSIDVVLAGGVPPGPFQATDILSFVALG